MQNTISVRNLTKWFSSPGTNGGRSVAVDGVDLDVRDGEFLAMVGPSGCGKSTILRLLSGLENASAGEIYMGGQRIDVVPPRSRNMGFMFQGYALFKHMTVADNIAFGLKIKRTATKQRNERVAELVSLMGLDDLEGRTPSQLSGGQQQRVALARGLAPWPRVLLLDEPFGAVDAKVRQKLRADTKRLQRQLSILTILVTHDQREALELGDRVAIMNQGKFEQIDTPQNIYDRPASPFVARFVGRVNVFDTELDGDCPIPIRGTRLEVMVRPEDISISPWDDGRDQRNGHILGTIVNNVFLGRTVRLDVQLRNGKLVTVALPKSQALTGALNLGCPVGLTIGSFQVFPVYGA